METTGTSTAIERPPCSGFCAGGACPGGGVVCGAPPDCGPVGACAQRQLTENAAAKTVIAKRCNGKNLIIRTPTAIARAARQSPPTTPLPAAGGYLLLT